MVTSNYVKTNKLPNIPNKRYFTIGEVGHLCGVKPHVLRYWEQEFPQLKPSKRRGNRRYYQRDDVIMIRNIRGLLYDEGYTISGARLQLDQIIKQDKQQDFVVKSNVNFNSSSSLKDKKNLLQSSSTSSHRPQDKIINNNICDDNYSENINHKYKNNYSNNTQNNLNNHNEKLKSYKIAFSEIIVELNDILTELENINTHNHSNSSCLNSSSQIELFEKA